MGSDAALDDEALGLLRDLTGDPESTFRGDQLEVIRRLVADRQRVLLVQRTGWGKSAVYFIATRMLRDRGAGPTLLVSPLLALMRNQIEAAERMGVRAATINSANTEDWLEIEDQLHDGRVDVLLISPERLANPSFRADVLPSVGRQSGLLVVDEAHCISDWGHDFRPDYRRIVRVLDLLPEGVPVLCCTATANDRVAADVTRQLGSAMAPVRGPLGRDGLALHVLPMPRQADRLAWLADNIERMPGTGIVYCLTIADADRVADWLIGCGVEAAAYSGATDRDERVEIERRLLANELKVVVATSALGMGFDKPDLGFVIHFQSPGSPISYYQQVGRAGRALRSSVGLLMVGSEDESIQDFFIRTAFPSAELSEAVVALLEEAAEPLTKNQILGHVNIRQSQLDQLLTTLEVDGAIERDGSRYLRTLRPWAFDHERVESVTSLRRSEQDQMRAYIAADTCRMQMLRGFLDDADAGPCGLCDVCTGAGLVTGTDSDATADAQRFLRRTDIVIEPRRQLPGGKRLAAEFRVEPGRALAVFGDGGWGSLIADAFTSGRVDEDLVVAAADLVRVAWRPDPAPAWVTFIPSRAHGPLVADLAGRLAAALGLPLRDVVRRSADGPPQSDMRNSHSQYANVRGVFEVADGVPDGPCLVVDDLVDSRWTITAIGYKLRAAGSGPVFPIVLADGAGRA